MESFATRSATSTSTPSCTSAERDQFQWKVLLQGVLQVQVLQVVQVHRGINSNQSNWQAGHATSG